MSARRRHRSQYHALMPIGVVSAALLCLPVAILDPLQPIRAWFGSGRRVVLYAPLVMCDPLIARASVAMALGILRYWIDQRKRGA